MPAESYISFYSPKRIEFYQSEAAGRFAKLKVKRPGVQVVIPMAGLGSRFSKAGYAKPKPFIDVDGATMIERVMDNLRVEGAKFVLIARREHLAAEPEVVDGLLTSGDVVFSAIDFVTEGAACTVLTAREHLDRDAPLLIANATRSSTSIAPTSSMMRWTAAWTAPFCASVTSTAIRSGPLPASTTWASSRR